MRAFVAIDIPEAIQAGLAAVRDRLKSAGVEAAWSQPRGLHLTLKFLGEVDEELTPGILQALDLALSGAKRLRLSIEGVGTFPNPASARVVWAGIAGDVGRLATLQAAVEQTVVGVGLARDNKPYVPHLTLGRIKRIRDRDRWFNELERLENLTLPAFDATSIGLIRSLLGPAGAVYRELGRVALK